MTSSGSHLAGVYPHVCGGAARARSEAWNFWGLSPRVRGSPLMKWIVPTGKGSIPTCAGEPENPPPSHSPPEVYPHVCGGADFPHNGKERQQGLSPRVRGSRSGFYYLLDCLRSIPTCAGEPVDHVRGRMAGMVYPHVCGGAIVYPLQPARH